MNEIQVFNNAEFGNVRTLEADGKVLFCGKDVATSLGYSDPKKAIIQHCKEDGVAIYPLTDNLGRTQQAKFITEGNLYRLISHSKLPTAERFESWVFDEVLPTIRRHGMYATDELLNNPDIAIAAFTALKEERERRAELETTIAVQSQQIQELTPKACYYDVVLNCADLLSTSKIAKDYGKSAVWLNRYLHEKGVQFKQGDIWLLYQKYAQQGYTSTKTHSYPSDDGNMHSKVHTYWTQKGRLFIYDLLKNDGILPIVEMTA